MRRSTKNLLKCVSVPVVIGIFLVLYLGNISNSLSLLFNKLSLSSKKESPQIWNNISCQLLRIAHEINLPKSHGTLKTWRRINQLCDRLNGTYIQTTHSNMCWKRNKTLMCIPNLLLAGFPKSGTTDLFHSIIKHPSVIGPSSKEPHFWTRNMMSRDLNSYAGNFKRLSLRLENLCALKINCRPNIITVDASPSTIWDDTFWYNEKTDTNYLPYFLSKLIPNLKIIVIMRNPITRLSSGYWYFTKGLKKSPELFDTIVRNSTSSFNECLATDKTTRFCISSNNKSPSRVSQCHLGLYYDHLLPWIEVLTLENIHFVRLEDYTRNKASEMNKILEFLNLTLIQNIDIKSNKHSNKKHSDMLNITKDYLKSFYHPYNLRLARLAKNDKFLWVDD